MRNAVAAAAALVLLAAGCTSSEGSAEDRASTGSASESAQDPSGTPSGSASETAAETPSETPTETATETATAEPVSGPVMEVQGITIQLPKGYRIGFDTPVVTTAQGRLGLVGLSAIAGEQWSLDRLYQDDLRIGGPMQSVERLPDTTLDGLPAYRYGGRRDRHVIRQVYGTWDSGYQVMVRFDLHDFMPEAKRQELVESVVATYDSPSG